MTALTVTALAVCFFAVLAMSLLTYRVCRDAMLSAFVQPQHRPEDDEVRVLMSDVDIAEALNSKELHALMVTAVDDVLSDTEIDDSERADLLATLTDIAEAYGRGLVLREKNRRY